jgi:inosine triphosphate pyrophosphatase
MSSAETTALPRLVFVTGNKNKIREVTEILKGVAIVESEKIDLPEIQGDILDIAREKAVVAYKQLQRPCMIEDSSLCFSGLGDLPGPYVKWFFDKLGNVGLHTMLQGFEDKSGYALCIFTVIDGPDKSNCKFYTGRCSGTIVAPRGPEGFGWDPIFQPDGFDKTFAELDADTKNRISHRKKALDALVSGFRGEPRDDETATHRKRDRD